MARVQGRSKALTQRELKDLFTLVDDEVRMLKMKDIPSILKRIPNFNLKFTDKQLRILAEETKKVLVVGWSGTGKTTCSVLQMIAIDLLFIAALKVKSGVKEVTADDIQPTGIRCVFITANDILCDQLKNFYHKVIHLVKSKLKSKKGGATSTVEDLVTISHGLLKNFDLDHFRDEDLKFSKGEGGDSGTDIIDEATLSKLKKGSIEELLSFLESHDFEKRKTENAQSF